MDLNPRLFCRGRHCDGRVLVAYSTGELLELFQRRRRTYRTRASLWLCRDAALSIHAGRTFEQENGVVLKSSKDDAGNLS